MTDAGVTGRRENAMSEFIGNRIVPKHCGVWDSTKAYEGLSIVLEEGSGDSYISRKDVPAGTGLNQTEYWALCARFSEQMALLRKETAGQVAGMEERTSAAEELTNNNKATLEERMMNIEARQDANVTASTDRNADYAAELVDARVDDTSRTFDSAGANLRAVGKVRSLQNIAKLWGWKADRFVNDLGNLSSSGNWSALYMIPVAGDRVIINGKLSYMSGKDTYNNIVCYDKSKKYLGGCFRSPESNPYYDYLEVPLLQGTCFISVSTGTGNRDSFSLYLPPDLRPAELMNNYATTWQWVNGTIEIQFASDVVSVEFLKNCYLCRRANGNEYVQTMVTVDESVEVMFAAKGWWTVYFEETVDGAAGAGTGDVEEPLSRIHVESCTDWQRLFTKDRFVLAVFYDSLVAYAAPVYGGLTINGIDYGNPAKAANQALSRGDTNSKHLAQSIFLEYGGITIDMENKSIQITKRILASCNTCPYFWLEVNEEPTSLIESEELEAGHMLILGYDHNTKTLNLYDTKSFQNLGIYGYYIASWYQGKLWYPHMSPSLELTYNGITYSAGELFASESYDTYIEKRYQTKFDVLDDKVEKYAGSTMYLASGSFAITQDGAAVGVEGANTVQITSKILGVPENKEYQWLPAQDEPVETPALMLSSPTGTAFIMRILAVNLSDSSINLYSTSQFRTLGANGYYVASWYNGKLYNAHMSPDVKVTVNGTEYSAGSLFDTEKASYIAQPYKDYVAARIASGNEEDDLGDLVTPSHWDCMEGRQFSMFFDCLSRHEGRENLYRVTNSKSLTRNEYCLNYTPAADDTDFNVNVIRLDEGTMTAQETKAVAVRVHHPLSKPLTKNICICGDSLVDNNYVATEVYRMLAEDGDCVINQLGVRGPAGGKHEGRGSWRWVDYLKGADYASKSNAFWDAEKGRLDFQKYCETNGYEDIDYFLIALGTNDVSQGSSLYRTEAQVQKFVDQAKQFIDALLSEETGFPNCKIGIGLCGPGADYSYLAGNSMGIFRKSINTLNLAMIKAFDEGAYHPNVTCFAHGLRTNRRLAFPYSDKPVTDRFTETSRTLTNSIHPSARGYQAWADGYYCQIRAWLEADAQ